MRYGPLFLVLGASIAALGAMAGGAALALLWPAVSFGAVGVAYMAARPVMLGKRADGTLAPWAIVLLAPYLLLALLILRVERILTRERAADEVAPGIWVGRRPLGREIPDRVRWVVDLTAELAASAAVRGRDGYLCVPVLDGTAPGEAALRDLLARLREGDGVLVHCASGHGRSATVAAALMVARGLAADVEIAEALMRVKRPGIRLNATQRARVRGLGP